LVFIQQKKLNYLERFREVLQRLTARWRAR
jgi:hypothetical protein